MFDGFWFFIAKYAIRRLRKAEAKEFFISINNCLSICFIFCLSFFFFYSKATGRIKKKRKTKVKKLEESLRNCTTKCHNNPSKENLEGARMPTKQSATSCTPTSHKGYYSLLCNLVRRPRRNKIYIFF